MGLLRLWPICSNHVVMCYATRCAVVNLGFRAAPPPPTFVPLSYLVYTHTFLLFPRAPLDHVLLNAVMSCTPTHVQCGPVSLFRDLVDCALQHKPTALC